MKERISELNKEVEEFNIHNEESLEQFRITYLSKKGLISMLLKDSGTFRLRRSVIPDCFSIISNSQQQINTMSIRSAWQ